MGEFLIVFEEFYFCFVKKKISEAAVDRRKKSRAVSGHLFAIGVVSLRLRVGSLSCGHTLGQGILKLKGKIVCSFVHPRICAICCVILRAWNVPACFCRRSSK